MGVQVANTSVATGVRGTRKCEEPRENPCLLKDPDDCPSHLVLRNSSETEKVGE